MVECDTGALITLLVKIDNLVQHSTYFKNLVRDHSDPNGSALRCRLPYENAVLLRFEKWINHPCLPKVYVPGSYSPDFWTSCALPMWFLAHEIGACVLERFALSHFIQNCALSLFGPWALIEQKAPWDSSLQRFSDYWVAWNYSLAGSEGGEYAGLRATHLAAEITDETRDPRIFDLEHWYSPCRGSFNLPCEHDPVYRKEKLKAARKVQETAEDWGEEMERSVRKVPIKGLK